MEIRRFQILIVFCFILIISCNVNPANDKNLETSRDITSFSLSVGQIGEAEIIPDADSAKVIIHIVNGTDLSNVTPQIELSQGASIKPASGMPVDLSTDNNRYTYIVTSESGLSKDWYLIINETVQKVTIILLPDIQSYVQHVDNRIYLTSQIDWILENKDYIDLVLQQGDLTNRNTIAQWEFVTSEFSRLDNVVPYILAVGNHDMGPGGRGVNRNTSYFNQYFPYSTMSELPYFGGVFPNPEKSDKFNMDNAYYLMETGQYKWLILTLEFGPRDIVLDWANEIAGQYNDRIAIINTHGYMYSDNTRIGSGDDWNPHNYDFAKLGSANDGEEMWNKLVNGNTNIRFVFSGHILHDGVGTLISSNDAGRDVYQFLANFQSGVIGSENGGSAYLRRVTVDFSEDKLLIETFSPYPDVGIHPNADHNIEIPSINLE